MATATLVDFWITAGGRRWKAKFTYADLTPSRTQLPNRAAVVTLSNGITGDVDSTTAPPDGIGSKRVVVVSGLFSRRVKRSDGLALTVSSSAALFSDAYGNAAAVLSGDLVLNRSMIGSDGDSFDFPIPDHTVPGYGVATDLDHANLLADYNPALDTFTDLSLHNSITDQSGNGYEGWVRTLDYPSRQAKFLKDYYGAGKHAWGWAGSDRARVGQAAGDTFDFSTTSFAGIFVGTTLTGGNIKLFSASGKTASTNQPFGGVTKDLSSANNLRRNTADNEKLVWGWTWDHTTSTFNVYVHGRKINSFTATPSTTELVLVEAGGTAKVYLQRYTIYSNTSGVALTDTEIVERMSRAMLDYDADPPRVLYVSTSGDDSNDGLTELTPVLTPAEALGRYRPQVGEQIRVKHGDVFASLGGTNPGDEPLRLEGNSWYDRAIICGYGDPADGRYDFGNEAFKTGSYATVSDAGFSNAIANPDSVSFDQTSAEASPTDTPFPFSTPDFSDLVVINCWIEGRTSGILLNSDDSGVSWAEVYRTQMAGIWEQGLGGHPQGIYSASGLDLFHSEDVAMRRPGHINTGRTIFDHGYYLYAKFPSIDHTVIDDSSAHGIMERAGGVARDNLLLRCPVGIVGDYAGHDQIDNVALCGSTKTQTGASRAYWQGSGVRHATLNNICIKDGTEIAQAIKFGSSGYLDAQSAGTFVPDDDWEVEIANNTMIGDWGIDGSVDRLSDIGILKIHSNVLDFGTHQLIYLNKDIADIPSVTIGDNLRASTNALPYANNAVDITEAAWDLATGESSPAVRSVSPNYYDDTRTPLTWHSTVKGGDGTYDGLILDMINAHATGFDASWGASEINKWVRAGYMLTAEDAGDFGGELPGIAYIAAPTVASSVPANGATGVASNQPTIKINWSTIGTQGLASAKFYLHDAADDSLLATIPANLALVNALDKVEQTVTLGITIGYGKSVYLLWDAGVFITQSGVPNAANTDKTALAFSTESAPAVGGNRSRDRSRER